MTISIKGIDKAEVLAALYNASRQQGMGFMHSRGATGMTVEEARKELAASPDKYFDYLNGRVMKIGLDTDDLEEWLYDRDNGHGAAARALAPLLSRSPAVEERPRRRTDDDDSAFIANMAIPSVMAEPDTAPVAEPFTGGGGEFSGAGASSSWDSGSSSDSGSSGSDSSSDSGSSGSSSDSGSSDSGSSSSSSD